MSESLQDRRRDQPFSGAVRVNERVAASFGDLHPPFEEVAAVAEANRCLFCFDAPCMQACPTHIDVPRFIKKIATSNVEGSARTILEANILGASCSRACPVDVLCEGACVLHRHNRKPIEIARLQRFAMDSFYASGAAFPFVPAEDTARKVALIGGGPASLACAAELRLRGIRAVIFDARPLPGGLNTYGIAEYKLTLRASLEEIDMLAQLGVEFHFNTVIDKEGLAEIEREYDAVFLGVGLGAIHNLGIPGEDLPGVVNALRFIADYKRGVLEEVPAQVAVFGAGNTAIDAAIAAVRLGAREVRLIYRRGPAQMSAFSFEYKHAREEGVQFLWHRQPVKIGGEQAVEAVELAELRPTQDGSLIPSGAVERVPAQMVVLAIGQAAHTSFLAEGDAKVTLERGRIVIDRATGQTTHAKFFAGGDCVNGGREVVDAVADGKRAAIGIAAWLDTRPGRADNGVPDAHA